MGELIPSDMVIGDSTVEFEFDFMDNGVRQAFFKYQSMDMNAVFTSNRFQNLQATVRQGPTSLDDIPTRVTDAVLMTVSEAPVTIPMADYRVRLILQGILQWEWDLNFEAPGVTFPLDGLWNQG